VSCYSNFITINRTTPSRSRLYAEDLPGVDSELWEALAKVDQTEDELWTMLYETAWNNLVSDVTHEMQERFFVDTKIVSRETSTFVNEVNIGDQSGVQIEFNLPRYARIHLVSVDLKSDANYDSPEVVISVLNDSDEVLSEHSEAVTEGKNTIFIDQEYEESILKIVYDAAVFSFRQTENKKYNSPYRYYSTCSECAFDCGGYEGKITQIGGGLNIKYNVVCSVEKFVCENINLFKQAFYYRIGLEILAERRFGHRLNQYMTMTLEAYEETFNFYNKNYQDNLSRSVRSQNMLEDPYCFKCKSIVTAKSSLP
jgi:hypothetical protein